MKINVFESLHSRTDKLRVAGFPAFTGHLADNDRYANLMILMVHPLARCPLTKG